MSLDVYLRKKRWVSYDEGKTHTVEHEEVFWQNITHNLGRMAREAGIYEALWRPEEIGITKAGDLISIIETGLTSMKAKPNHFAQFNASNGWGTYEQFVPWIESYLSACKQYSEAEVFASR